MNLGRAVQAAFDEGLLLAGGGHAMAAGLSVRPDAIPELRAFLCERLAAESEIAAAEDAPGDRRPGHHRAAATGRSGRTSSAWRRSAPAIPSRCSPLADVRVERPMALRGGHVRCTLTDGSGGRLKAVAWRVRGHRDSAAGCWPRAARSTWPAG